MTDYLAILLALILLVLFLYNLLLRRDKNNLTEYVVHLKKQVKQFKNKIKSDSSEHEEEAPQSIESNVTIENDKLHQSLTETHHHLQQCYKKQYGHDISETDLYTRSGNASEHFVYLVAHEGINAKLDENNHQLSPEGRWDNLKTSLMSLIDDYSVMPNKEFDKVIEEAKNFHDKKKRNASIEDPEATTQIVRTVEINRLKDQLKESADTILDLQKELANVSPDSYNGETIQRLAQGLKKVSEENKQYKELTETMDEDISCKDSKIDALTDQLEKTIEALDQSSSKLLALETSLALRSASDDPEEKRNSDEIKGEAVKIAEDLAERIDKLKQKGSVL